MAPRARRPETPLNDQERERSRHMRKLSRVRRHRRQCCSHRLWCRSHRNRRLGDQHRSGQPQARADLLRRCAEDRRPLLQAFRASRSQPAHRQHAVRRCDAHHVLEATEGQTYSQMGRFLDAKGNPTSDEALAAKDPTTGQPVENGLRNIWVTETALTTALNTAYLRRASRRVRNRHGHCPPADGDRVPGPHAGRRAAPEGSSRRRRGGASHSVVATS